MHFLYANKYLRTILQCKRMSVRSQGKCKGTERLASDCLLFSLSFHIHACEGGAFDIQDGCIV